MSSNRGRVAIGLAAAAVGWALLLIASAFFFPAYSSGSTIYAENGWVPVALLTGIGAVASAGFYALHVVCSTGSDRAAKIATSCAVLVMAFAMVSAASIGLFVLPVALLLGASAVLTPQPVAPRGS
jgi:hypothetical protein